MTWLHCVVHGHRYATYELEIVRRPVIACGCETCGFFYVAGRENKKEWRVRCDDQPG